MPPACSEARACFNVTVGVHTTQPQHAPKLVHMCFIVLLTLKVLNFVALANSKFLKQASKYLLALHLTLESDAEYNFYVKF